jgi:hypothetical protein
MWFWKARKGESSGGDEEIPAYVFGPKNAVEPLMFTDGH